MKLFNFFSVKICIIFNIKVNSKNREKLLKEGDKNA